MPDDEKPNPFEDIRKGLGLLFRAAKTTVEKLPTKDLEELVVTSAREVGRAIENVGKTVEREVIRVKDDLKPHPPAPPGADAPKPGDAPAEAPKADAPKPDEPAPPTGTT